MDIYWIKEKKRCGPATVPDVLSLLQTGELSPETLGWHPGCAGWLPLRELPALSDFLTPPEAETAPQEEAELPPIPPAETENAPDGATIVRVYLPSPGMRLLARMVDIALYFTLVYGVVYVRQIPFEPLLLPGSPLFWLPFILLETALVSVLGTTPGKAMLGIYIRSVVDNGALGAWRSFSRAMLVFVAGMGMMFSFLPLVMMGFALWSIKRRGITLWDARSGTLPLQTSPTHPLRRILAIVLLVVCFHLVSLCMEPWLPPMLEAIGTQSPETAEWLRNLTPPAP